MYVRIVHGLKIRDDIEAGTASHCEGMKYESSEVMNSFIIALITANRRNTATFTMMMRSSVFAVRNWFLIFPENPAAICCEDMRKKKFKLERKCY